VLPETTVFTGFDGTLDDFGTGAARMVLSEPLTPDGVGGALRFSLELDDPQTTVVGTVCVRILD